MQFSANAKQGLTKIFFAGVIGIVATLIAVSAVLWGLSSFDNTTIMTVVSIMALLSAVLAVGAFVVKLMGIKQASKAENNYSTAFSLCIAYLAVAVVFVVLGRFVEFFRGFSFSLLPILVEGAVLSLVCNATSKLFDRMNNDVLSKTAKRMSLICAVLNIVSFIAMELAIRVALSWAFVSVSLVCFVASAVIYLLFIFKVRESL